MNDTDKSELALGSRFWNKATLTTEDQPDGGDTWHISKKNFNNYLDEIDEAIQYQCNQARIDEHHQELTFILDADSSADYKQGFSDATNQISKYRNRRIVELQAQAKETEGE